MPPSHWPRTGLHCYAKHMDIRSIFVLISLLVAGTAVAEEAYRWVDDQGVVHYSDRPRPGAERIILPTPNTVTRSVRQSATSGTAASTTATAQSPGPAAAFRYDSLAVASPGVDETLWNIEGVLNVSLTVTPAMQSSHQVRVYFDGKTQIMQGTNFQIQDVYRGEHNIQAEIIDATGKLMIRSQSNRFFVQQNTIR